MSIEKMILNVATHYHANLIDIHNALYALGLRSDDHYIEYDFSVATIIIVLFFWPIILFWAFILYGCKNLYMATTILLDKFYRKKVKK
jgi:hypothetical protein